MSAAVEPRFTRFSLGRVLDDLGLTLLEVAYGRIDVGGNVGGAVIYDPVDEQTYPARAIVLGPGVRDGSELEEMLAAVALVSPLAVVVRSPVELTDQVRQMADEHAIVVLGLARGATWTQLNALLRSLLAEDDIGEAHVDSLGGIPSGDLFAVANAISSLLDAPVTIEDRSLRVLGFSGGQEETDTARTETIIGRRVPARYTQILTERGVFRDLYRSHDPVVIDAIEFDDERSMQRVAIGVHAGDELLGSIWAAMEGPLTAERTATLRDAAKLVALHLLRLRAGADVQRRLRAELLSTALEGGAGAGEALSRLNLSGRAVCVVAAKVEGTADDDVDPAEQTVMAARERFADAFAVHLSALRPGSAVALMGDTVFGIMPASNDLSGAGALHTMEDFLERMGTRASASIAIGPPAEDLAGLTRSRTDAGRILRAMREWPRTGRGSRPTPRVARLTDVHAVVLALELKDLMRSRGDEIAGPLSILVAHDLRHNGHLVQTLRAWFDFFGDANKAADALFVHPNTFRYRLRRAIEVSGLDLNDSDERFVVMIQLRLLDL